MILAKICFLTLAKIVLGELGENLAETLAFWKGFPLTRTQGPLNGFWEIIDFKGKIWAPLNLRNFGLCSPRGAKFPNSVGRSLEETLMARSQFSLHPQEKGPWAWAQAKGKLPQNQGFFSEQIFPKFRAPKFSPKAIGRTLCLSRPGPSQASGAKNSIGRRSARPRPKETPAKSRFFSGIALPNPFWQKSGLGPDESFLACILQGFSFGLGLGRPSGPSLNGFWKF